MSSSTQKESRPIYIWPKGADLSELKAAVLEMNLPFAVVPYWFEPGEHSRCIALAEGFDCLADHAYPKNNNTRKIAVEWFFGMRDLPQAKTVLSKLESVFGEVKEVYPDWPRQSE